MNTTMKMRITSTCFLSSIFLITLSLSRSIVSVEDEAMTSEDRVDIEAESTRITTMAISSSGKSQNILNAINVAHEKGAGVVTFTGFEKDNPAMKSGDMNVYVPCSKYGIVESIHNLMLQEIVDIIMERDGVRI